MAQIWVNCKGCKGAAKWVVNGMVVICGDCNGTGGGWIVV